MYRPGQHTFTCLDGAMLSVQQATITRDDQTSTISTGECVFVVQEEVHLEYALDLMVLHLPVGPPITPHRGDGTRMDT
jgi:hypothetical protein